MYYESGTKPSEVAEEKGRKGQEEEAQGQSLQTQPRREKTTVQRRQVGHGEWKGGKIGRASEVGEKNGR